MAETAIRGWDLIWAVAIVCSVSTGAPVSKSEMKLLVLAQTPPPAHGQSLAVAALLEHLRSDPGFQVHHVDMPLSRNAADVGRWRPGKMVTTIKAGLAARRVLVNHAPMALYYVPAPGKRGAVYRDWLLMSLTRSQASAIVLHWHAVGLGAWVDHDATAVERALTRRLLGRATLAVVQAEACRADADRFAPLRSVVIANGVRDPWPAFTPKAAFNRPCEVLFVGLGCREKGLFDALEGIRLANLAQPGAFRFTAVGPFASAHDQQTFLAQAARQNGVARHAGFVSLEERNRLFRTADVLCFPTYYPHEGQPAVILEALAHDLPVVTTRWRGVPENLPTRFIHLVGPRAPAEVAAALQLAQREGPGRGVLRRHFLDNFTQERHLREMSAALRRWTTAGTPT
jgi:glycosyltransferase involved in cell wall biosynthesis